MGIKVFVSHSSIDSALVTLFVDCILAGGLDIKSYDITCTSTGGYKIQLGSHIDESIKSCIYMCDFSVFIITKNFLSAKYCLYEMGAVWALSKRSFFFLHDSVSTDVMSDIFKRNNCAYLSNKSDLIQFYNDYASVYEQKLNFPLCNRKIDEFSLSLSSLSLVCQETVDIEEYKKLKDECDQYKNEYERQCNENDRLKDVISKIKQSKTKKEIEDVELNSLPSLLQFEAVVENAKKALNKIKHSRIVRECIYYHTRGTVFEFQSVEMLFDRFEINRALEDKQIKITSDNTGFDVDIDDTLVNMAVGAVNDLKLFIDKNYDEVFDGYSKKYSSRLDIEIRGFWEEHLGL